NSILGFAQILARKTLPPDQRRSVDYILKAGRHLLELINEVLDIARIEANRLQLSLEPVSVSGVLGEALTLIQPLGSQRGCRIDAGGNPDCGRFVLADRQRLTQVVLNLLSNAVKYNRPNGQVDVRCERITEDGSERLCIRVRDTGPGIAPENLGRLFVPFERLGADQSDIEGTGLGLALSKRLVEAMGGSLTVESVVGEGSTFVVSLALVESPLERLGRSTPPAAPEGVEAAAPEKSATLLYIEDNLANLSLIETILSERPEIELRSALQGRLGLDLAWEHRPDLILLDLHLPDISGEEVLRRLQNEPRTREIPVIVISADATPGTIERLMGAGARGYLPKPLDVDLFLSTVDEAIDTE
ncbi:MAG TPA: ATP-binding protein, partial [Armatimonadota bacterium]|nr:ATP-binding protein [Armatimonadota bacterium]